MPSKKALNTAAPWAKLSAEDFELLISWMLHREGFFNISWRGDTAGQGNRVMICNRTHFSGADLEVMSYVIQCRQHDKNPTKAELQEQALANAGYHPDRLVLVTPSSVTKATRKSMQKAKPGADTELVIWDRSDLVHLLENHQDLRLRLFDVAPSPYFFVRHLTDRERQFVDFGRLFQRKPINRFFEESCRIAINKSTRVTIAHLLVALIRLDTEFTQTLLKSQDLDPTEIAGYLETLVTRGQNRIDLKLTGLSLSSSFRSVLDTAIIITQLFDNQILTERSLLLAILMHPTSVSVNALNQLCAREEGEQVILNALLETYYSAQEREMLLGAFGEGLEALGTEQVEALWDRFEASDDTGRRDGTFEETATFALPDVAFARRADKGPESSS